ncbi:unnamed protein product [Arctia plantaginis]|uniref:Uncharacterized protein n=1 Tax=Arctia plantaginis TaxID=874455 RepID=A0A8S0YM85_ARCPL|nr:unnamed protein product [Arctia plantaginis]
MALVLRKAVLPKNISLLKWIKGRPLATAAKRSDATAISTLGPRLTVKEQVKSMLRDMSAIKIKKPQPVEQEKAKTPISLHKSNSCPCLLPSRGTEEGFVCRYHQSWLPRTKSAIFPSQSQAHERGSANLSPPHIQSCFMPSQAEQWPCLQH